MMIVATVAGFVCFMVMDLTGEGKELTNAKIFSTLDLLGTLKVAVLYMGVSLGFYFELRIFFQRFCQIMNIEDKRMIEINEEAKKPIKKPEDSIKKQGKNISPHFK